MPLICFRLVPALCLAVALAACAPATKSAPPAASAKTAAGKTPPAQSSNQASPTTQRNGFRVVMGKPLPDQAAPAPAPGQPATPGQTPAPVAGQPTTPGQIPGPIPAPAPPSPAAVQPLAPGQGAPALGATPPDGSAAPAGQPTGFGGLTFGDSSKSRPGLAFHEAEKGADVVTCIWPQGPRDVFGAPIREAFYEFYKDRFYHVWIEFDGMAAYKTALEGLVRAYGPPTKEVPEKYYHAWSLGDVNVYCAFHPVENEGDVSFFYQPIYEPMMAERAKAAKAGKAAPRSRKP
ncbi:hypothetical protein [Solidesulfovibrio sp.]|uniref:hypothetical protein n=1 Tax=Solidesulfovibrio sp. TaxID=2910990 RepID=UPI002601E058|nr:hypothetical protein [Solidesulfovibrio sp.]